MDKSLLGWLCDLMIRTEKYTSGQTGAADVLEDGALSNVGRWEWVLVSRGDGMCWGPGIGAIGRRGCLCQLRP